MDKKIKMPQDCSYTAQTCETHSGRFLWHLLFCYRPLTQSVERCSPLHTVSHWETQQTATRQNCPLLKKTRGSPSPRGQTQGFIWDSIDSIYIVEQDTSRASSHSSRWIDTLSWNNKDFILTMGKKWHGRSHCSDKWTKNKWFTVFQLIVFILQPTALPTMQHL